MNLNPDMLEYGKNNTGDMPTFNYSGYHLPSDEMRVKHPHLVRFGCLGALMAFLAMWLLIYLGIWYPDFWLAVAIIGVPALTITWAALLALALTAQV